MVKTDEMAAMVIQVSLGVLVLWVQMASKVSLDQTGVTDYPVLLVLLAQMVEQALWVLLVLLALVAVLVRQALLVLLDRRVLPALQVLLDACLSSSVLLTQGTLLLAQSGWTLPKIRISHGHKEATW